MVVDAIQADLRVAATADGLGSSHTTICMVVWDTNREYLVGGITAKGRPQ